MTAKSPTSAPTSALVPVGGPAAVPASRYVDDLVDGLTVRGLRAERVPHVGLPGGAMAVTAQRVDVAPYAGRVVVLLPAPQGDGLYWHWRRPFRGKRPAKTVRRPGAVWYQPFCSADDPDAAADAIDMAIEADLRARARRAHALTDAVDEPDREVLTYVGYRVHSLVSRMLEQLKATQNDQEDPDVLDELYAIDHLATQLRRAAERMAVLGGRTARRARAPMPISTVMRQTTAEVESFERVRLTLPADDRRIPGHAGPDVIHLLAELVENGTKFSPPNTTVHMVAVDKPERFGIEVRNQAGLLPSAEMLEELRRIVAAPHLVSPRHQVRQGQIGVLVAARLAARHGIGIELESDESGTRALVVLPDTLLQPPVPANVPARVPTGAAARPPKRADAAPPAPPPPAPPSQPPPPAPPSQPPPPAPPPAPPLGVSGGPSGSGEPAADGRPALPRRHRSQPAAHHPAPRRAAPDQAGEPGPGPRRAPTPGLIAAFTAGARNARADRKDHGDQPATS